MKTAVISDIHSNLEALTATLDHIYSEKVDRILCLGDIIGYGPNPNECVSLVEEHCHTTVMGNHDAAAFNPAMAQEFNKNARYAIEWTGTVLTDESKAYLETRAMREESEDITIVHATPYDPYLWYYISSIEDAQFNFNFFTSKFCFIGHTHIPGIIMENKKSSTISIHKPPRFKYGKYPNNRYIINSGSVGQPRDKDPKSCYAILDTEKETINFHRVEYDIESYQEKMRALDMPTFLVERVKIGK